MEILESALEDWDVDLSAVCYSNRDVSPAYEYYWRHMHCRIHPGRDLLVLGLPRCSM